MNIYDYDDYICHDYYVNVNISYEFIKTQTFPQVKMKKSKYFNVKRLLHLDSPRIFVVKAVRLDDLERPLGQLVGHPIDA